MTDSSDKQTVIQDDLRIKRRCVLFFFFVLLLVGALVSRDYGVGWDEGNNRFFGNLVFTHVFGDLNDIDIKDPMTHNHEYWFWNLRWGQFVKTHGPFYEVLLVVSEKVLQLQDTRSILLLRHLMNFVMFCLAAAFLYLLCSRIFRSWKVGLMGSLFLALSPRIFSHSFHNSYDIAFLTMYLMSIYTLVRYLEEKSIYRACLHAAACALMIDIRVSGVIIPCFTLAFLFLEFIFAEARKSFLRKTVVSAAVYVVLLCGLVVLFWPYLWEDPLNNFLAAFKAAANDPWGNAELYMGERIAGRGVPWHFTPVWVGITTPPLYIALFAVGLVSLIASAGNLRKFYIERKFELLALLSFFCPLLAVAVFKSTLFNGWRHFYFIYPPFLVICVSGLFYLLRAANAYGEKKSSNLGRVILFGLVGLGLLPTVLFMFESHPHQNVYFNSFVGGLKGAKGNFEIGVWGSEYREGLEYILKNDPRESITCHQEDHVLKFNGFILTPAERKRLQFVGDLEEADYYLINYCSHPWCRRSDEEEFEEIWSREVEGVKILTIYRVR